MEDLVSIIIPVYNTEAYLRDCVQSALAQSYPHFELILIDDGSEDGSASLCASLCGEDRRIRFLPRPHMGVSTARNAGMEAAGGKYLFFLDSDDTMHPLLLEALVHLCEGTGAALATEVYRHVKAAEARDIMDSRRDGDDRSWEYTYMDNGEALRQFSSFENGYNFHGIGGKLVRRDAAGELRFRERMGNSEDTLFIYQLLEQGLDAVILWKEWYEYRKHPGGSSRRLSIQACKDSYQCQRYIRSREEAREGETGVSFWTVLISAHLRRLYVRSRMHDSREMILYLRELAREESESSRFSLIPWKERVKHYMAFRCYPLYVPLHGIMTLRWKIREWKQKRAREREGWNG